MRKSKTTISISRQNKERLAALGGKGDSYDDIITELLNNKCDKMNETIIRFTGCRNNTSISGWMNIEDAGEKPLNFYTAEGFENGAEYPENPFPETYDGREVQNYTDFEILKESMQNDDLLIQLLVDFAEDDKTIDRGEYCLIINDGD